MWVSVKREVQRAKQHVGGQWSKLEEKENPLGGRRRRRRSWGLRGSRMNQAAAEWVEIIEPRTKVSADGFKVISASSLLSVFYQDHPHKDHPHQDHLEHQDHRSQGANIHCELQNCSCTHDPPVRKSLQVEAIHIMDCRLPIEIHLNTPRYWKYHRSLQNVTETRGIGSWDPMNLLSLFREEKHSKIDFETNIIITIFTIMIIIIVTRITILLPTMLWQLAGATFWPGNPAIQHRVQ